VYAGDIGYLAEGAQIIMHVHLTTAMPEGCVVHLHEKNSKTIFKIPTAQSYGGVIFSRDGKVLLREPIDHADGYVWTWPKGRPELGENPAQTALREVHEETGYRAKILGALPKVYIGTTRTNAFFIMAPVGEQLTIINETAQIRWVGYEEACALIKLTKHAIGRNRDRAILDDAMNLRSNVMYQAEDHLPVCAPSFATR
jgi:8-oxo-dGTP pyrophosphatase MutT (NUDIX family)